MAAISLNLMAFANNENFAIGARSAAMANASVGMSDVWSTQHNQAGLAFIRHFSAGVNYENRFLLKALSIKSGAFAIPVKAGTFGLCVRSFGYTLYKENKYGVSFAKGFGNKFAAAATFNYLTTNIAENYGNTSCFTGEIGIQAKPLSALTIGAHLYNPTRSTLNKLTNERLPTIMRLGIHYEFSKKGSVVIETEKDMARKTVFKAGIEYIPIKEFYLRMGIATNPALSSFGFGAHLKNFNIDIAANYHQVLGITSQISLAYTFDR